MPDNGERNQVGLQERILRCLHPVDAAPTITDERAFPIAHGDYDLNPDARRPGISLRSAAVLAPLVRRSGGLTVLLTRRTDHLPQHAGQVSFPGGRVEPVDRTVVDTALRETEEEIGLRREYVKIAGLLDPYETLTGYRIMPVVGFVSPGFRLTLDPHEVAAVFEVPFAFLLDPNNRQVRHVTVRSQPRTFYAFQYGEHFIWGATAGMLVGFLRRMGSM